ncbi:MAG: PriCT-2 domain-containing protein, partial [Magnetococcales bacterium]|nr:PriCT-2 domain-containing protein [Magnetococcales bacterium]
MNNNSHHGDGAMDERKSPAGGPGGGNASCTHYTAPDPRGQPPTLPEIESAMAAIDPGCDRQTWFTVAAALKDALGDQEGFHLFAHWSRGGGSYNPADTRDTWRSIREGGGIGIKSLFKLARDAGWRWESERSTPRNRATARPTPARHAPSTADHQAKARLRATWKASLPLDHPGAEPARRYMKARGLDGILADLPGPEVVRCHPALPYWQDGREIGRFPALVAVVQDVTGRAVSLH